MKQPMLKRIKELTLLTLLGTGGAIISSQDLLQANSLMTGGTDHQTASQIAAEAIRTVSRTDRTAEATMPLSRSIYQNNTSILNGFLPSVVGENSVSNPLQIQKNELPDPLAKPNPVGDKNQVAPKTPRPANNATAKPPAKPEAGVGVKQVRARKSGMASWYGPGFHGRRTANGERFNAEGLTAAHRYLPFGTQVRVTNRRTGRSVVVRINDRGPFTGGRVIDLSKGAARMIGVFQSGVAPVLLEVLGR